MKTNEIKEYYIISSFIDNISEQDPSYNQILNRFNELKEKYYSVLDGKDIVEVENKSTKINITLDTLNTIYANFIKYINSKILEKKSEEEQLIEKSNSKDVVDGVANVFNILADLI